ncbi:MAG: nitroreductase family protein [Peptoniphilaceae bacterium]|nr:nitroreductase family protein [Peptoniphilaceae bacterium]
MKLNDLLKNNRSYRSFYEAKKIDENIAFEILDAQKYAARGVNSQKLRYTLVLNEEKVNKITSFSRWAGKIPNDEGRPKEGHRPVMYIIVYSDKKAYSEIDEGIAINCIRLKAIEKNIGSCIVKSFNKEKVNSLVEKHEGFEISTVIAFGYPDHKSEIVETDNIDTKYFRDENGNYTVERISTEKISYVEL